MAKEMKAEYLLSARSVEQFPRDLGFEVAFFGRSNVGKSSLLNTFTGLKKLAKVSATPGCTREINFFLVNNRYYLVDLPGYGYAKYSKEEQKRWSDIIMSYLKLRSKSILGAVILDIRRGVTDLDINLFDILVENNVRFEIIATKSDKLKKSELRPFTLKLKSELEALGLESDIVRFSSETGEGQRELYNLIQKHYLMFKNKDNSDDEVEENL
ncbi:MAG: ribosome biogenesis GTP-binding protein YihA/YsxC [Candidatus Wallbacteria bacterium]